MFGGRKVWAGGLALAVAVAASAALASAGSGAAASRGCGAFDAQGDAQDAFLEAGGTPGRNVARMDGDHDGVACEGLPAPYKGYATIGYNQRKRFFYGVATMPSPAAGEGFPCLRGDRHYPESSRALTIMRIKPKRREPVVVKRSAKAEARPARGRLLWKVDRRRLAPGRYYAAFELSIPTTPYGRAECPGFESRPTMLPQPRKSSKGSARR